MRRVWNRLLRKWTRRRKNYPETDGRWECPAGVPALSPGPGRVISVDRKGAWSVTVEHNVKGVGQVLSYHLHLDRVRADLHQRVDAGQPVGILGTTGTTLRHDHFELHEGGLGKGLVNHEWWRATAVDPEPIITPP